ncbi:MAG TPA: GNAT family N-acetyltransferase [Thermoanaerobaculia bacterium]|nr:GNAT family N-acetyltransferase [Thermoanaerobaculia bacterium]
MQSPSIYTIRLELRAGNREIYNIPFDDSAALARALDANIPDNWPVENYDADPLVWSIKKLDENPAAEPWLLRYFIERETNTLIGFGGGCGLPIDGAWTIGYSVLPQFRRRGYASEATAALIAEAFGHAEVERIIAETYPELVASIGVMQKNGFVFVGPGEGERVIRYERHR